jgi:hypothetical protein
MTAAELLLLAELVVLVVLERRQLFEPVNEKVTATSNHGSDTSAKLLASGNFADMRAALGHLRER